MHRISWRVLGHLLNLTLVLLICGILSSAKANSADPAVADSLNETYFEDEPAQEISGLDTNMNIEEEIDSDSDLNKTQAVEENFVDQEPLPEGVAEVSDVEEVPTSLPSDGETVSEEKTIVEAVMDDNGEVTVDDRPVAVPAAAEDEDDDSIVEEKFDETDFLSDEEKDLDSNLNAEVMKEPPREDLQGSPLREFDIKSELQDSPLRQYDIKSDLQSSPLLKYEVKFSGKEANAATEKGRSFGEYNQNKMAPKFKKMKAPYNKASKQGSIVEEKY